MARVCELSGKRVMSGNKVSHAVNRTRRRFLPNLQNVTLLSDSLARRVRLRVSAAALRSVEHRGGLDAYLLQADETALSARARLYRKKVLAKTPPADVRPSPKRRSAPGKKAQKARARMAQAK